jgi:hypothetical protein
MLSPISRGCSLRWQFMLDLWHSTLCLNLSRCSSSSFDSSKSETWCNQWKLKEVTRSTLLTSVCEAQRRSLADFKDGLRTTYSGVSWSWSYFKRSLSWQSPWFSTLASRLCPRRKAFQPGYRLDQVSSSLSSLVFCGLSLTAFGQLMTLSLNQN